MFQEQTEAINLSLSMTIYFKLFAEDEFLIKLGAISHDEDGNLRPTAAGILMFGNEHEIVRIFPHYFLDYQEHFDPGIRWTDRFISSSGEWSGNLLDFFFKAYSKMIQNPSIKTPFKLEGMRSCH